MVTAVSDVGGGAIGTSFGRIVDGGNRHDDRRRTTSAMPVANRIGEPVRGCLPDRQTFKLAHWDCR